jgi:hypothetical protein
MKFYKGNIDYEGRILRQQEIAMGEYSPCVRPDNADELKNWEPPKKSITDMIIESKYYLLGALSREDKPKLVIL